tara:strand:- start:479 stop:1048 length:570 start_codon:yes stop_codon:yes gene_type:complete
MSDRYPDFRQIENRNYLSPTGFYFTVVKSPKAGYFGYQVNVPGLDLGVATQATYLTDIPRAGEKLTFGDLTLTFLVDEDLSNYLEIQNWMRGLGFPESLDQIYDWQKRRDPTNYPGVTKDDQMLNLYSDGTLAIYNSADNPNFKVTFKDMFPSSLSPLQFDSQQTDVQYLTATVNFKYTVYNIDGVICC